VVLVIEESTIRVDVKEVLNIERTYVFVKKKEAKSLGFQIIKGPSLVKGFLVFAYNFWHSLIVKNKYNVLKLHLKSSLSI